MSQVIAVAPVPAENRYAQAEITAAFASVASLHDPGDERLLLRVHGSAQVTHRYLALPLEDYPKLGSFTAANDAFIEVAVRLGARAVGEALDRAGIDPVDVDLIVSTTVTGLAVPSLDARIAGLIGLPPQLKRMPLVGLGCVGGAAGLARAHDYLTGHPNGVAVLLSVELCSLTFQRDDVSPANLIASGLFGDGATAVVLTGLDHPRARHGPRGPRITDTRSHLYPGTERVMGWDIGEHGFAVVLSADVPQVVRDHLGDDVRTFLDDHGLTIADVAGWVSHPGGPKVIDAIVETLDLPPGALELTWRSLADVGNLSSSSVLFVLHDTMAQRVFPPGAPGVLMAMGPGFCSELVLLEW
jgi:alkylresorcinol/alkylpyrone synthase